MRTASSSEVSERSTRSLGARVGDNPTVFDVDILRMHPYHIQGPIALPTCLLRCVAVGELNRSLLGASFLGERDY